LRKCFKCSQKAQVYLPQHRLSLCKDHYLQWFDNRVEKTIKEFKMFKKEDKILVAVSGGKDSLSLWKALTNLGYQADGFYINLGIGEYSEKSEKLATAFSEKIGRPLYKISLKQEIMPIPEIKKHDSRPTCSVCGTVKRYYMNKFAKDNGYKIIATGHNLDDEAAVLFSNTLNWSVEYLKRQYPVLPEEDGFIRKVKPLCKISEKESAMYAILSGIEYIEEECPFSEGATSIDYKIFLSQLEEKSPGTKLRFYSEFLRKMYPILQKSEEKPQLRPCKICGEPSINEICSVCNLKLKLKKQEEKA